MALAYFAVSLVGAVFTINAYRPFARQGPLSIPSFFAGWITSELPMHHILWQAVATGVFAAYGALHGGWGWAGLVVTAVSWAGLVNLVREAQRSAAVLDGALRDGLGEDYRERILPELADRIDPHLPVAQIVLPFAPHHRDVERTRSVPYGSHGRRNTLDVYRHADRPERCPVLLQIHGGAWVMGRKEEQALPLMNHLASRGWVCVAMNYRLSPRWAWPAHIVDVKRAIAWVKDHIAEYGGNPDFVVLTGGSAGGHLSSLAALTPNDPAWQPGFEDCDTTVQGCVPLYGIYDFTNGDGLGRSDMKRFLERAVFKTAMEADRQAFERASPVYRVTADAPPFLVVHGRNDSLAPLAEAQGFVRRLRAASRRPVAYAELPGAQHAFEVFGSVRTGHTVRAIERFCAAVYSDHLRAAGAPAPTPVDGGPA